VGTGRRCLPRWTTHASSRAPNAGAIERSLTEAGDRDRLAFASVDLPYWPRSGEERSAWNARLLSPVEDRRGRDSKVLRRERDFTVVWHLALANLRMGSLAHLGEEARARALGGGVSPPLSLLPALRSRTSAYESVRATARTVGLHLNPLARQSWRRAELVLAQNAAVLRLQTATGRAWSPALDPPVRPRPHHRLAKASHHPLARIWTCPIQVL
jgi:hypothetical protein